MTEFVYAVIKKEDWKNESGDLMLSSSESCKVFDRLDSAIRFVLHEVADLEAYAYSIGVKSKDVSVTRMLDDNYVDCRMIHLMFPDDRVQKETKAVTWKIEKVEFIKD